jgi:hypothetical protein
MRVLDLGGTPAGWTSAPVRPAALTMVNVRDKDHLNQSAEFEYIIGDACELPRQLQGRTFDLVYSNSVIEHLGGYARRAAFARVVERLGEHYWIQTPNRYFPLEPHWLFPGFQFLPVRARAALSRRWRLSWHRRHFGDQADVMGAVLATELVSGAELAYLFPHAVIIAERFAGLKKSLIATR